MATDGRCRPDGKAWLEGSILRALFWIESILRIRSLELHNWRLFEDDALDMGLLCNGITFVGMVLSSSSRADDERRVQIHTAQAGVCLCVRSRQAGLHHSAAVVRLTASEFFSLGPNSAFGSGAF